MGTPNQAQSRILPVGADWRRSSEVDDERHMLLRVSDDRALLAVLAVPDARTAR
jgi:hypothetical protein